MFYVVLQLEVKSDVVVPVPVPWTRGPELITGGSSRCIQEPACPSNRFIQPVCDLVLNCIVMDHPFEKVDVHVLVVDITPGIGLIVGIVVGFEDELSTSVAIFELLVRSALHVQRYHPFEPSEPSE